MAHTLFLSSQLSGIVQSHHACAAWCTRLTVSKTDHQDGRWERERQGEREREFLGFESTKRANRNTIYKETEGFRERFMSMCVGLCGYLHIYCNINVYELLLARHPCIDPQPLRHFHHATTACSEAVGEAMADTSAYSQVAPANECVSAELLSKVTLRAEVYTSMKQLLYIL